MILYRLVKRRYAVLSGDGAKEYGGRWNKKGIPALYLTESVALAVCESLVHLEVKRLPPDRVLMLIEVPDREISFQYQNFDLKKESSEAEGSRWLQMLSDLCIKVPSAVIPYSYNYVVNPLHSKFAEIKIIAVGDFFIKEVNYEKLP